MIHSSFAVRGGAERYVRHLSHALRARGHEVRVFARPSPDSEPDDRALGDRVSTRLATRLSRFKTARLRKVVVHLGDLFDPTGLSLRDLQEFSPDVVHVHNWQGLGVLPVARLTRAYPTCHTVHDHAICDPNSALANVGRSKVIDALLRLRAAWLVRKLRPAFLLWPALRARESVGLHAPGVRRLAGQVVTLAVPRTTPLMARPGGRKDMFLFLGTLSPHKGIDVLLAAWRAAGPRTGGTLLIAGDGPRREAVERFARTDASVRPLGYLDDAAKEAALCRAGWLVFPSQLNEMFPLACAEALQAGRPIITSARAFPPAASAASTLVFHTPDALGAALESAARLSDEEYERMCAAAAADGSRLDWAEHVDRVLDVYATLRAGRGRTSGEAAPRRADRS